MIKIYREPLKFKFIIINMSNPFRDDILIIQSFRLPGNLPNNEIRNKVLEKEFASRLRIEW